MHTSGLGLSGGQQQRLCIARAIAIKPEIILMDEPASALDPIATARIEELILDLKQDFTIVIVTHNMQQAARISDHTAFFYLGELIEYDTTTKIFTNPARNKPKIMSPAGSGERSPMQTHFEKELADLKDKLLTMASHAETAVRRAVEALMTRDERLAKQVRENEDDHRPA